MSMDFTNEEKRILKQVASSDILDLTSEASDPTEIWVDGDNGDDANPGTQAEPLQTFDAAISRVPATLNSNYVLRFSPGTYTVDTLLERGFVCAAGSLHFSLAQLPTVLQAQVAATGADGTRPNMGVVVAGAGWTTNEFRGKTLRCVKQGFGDGTDRVVYKTIVSNTSDTIYVASGVSDTFASQVPFQAGDLVQVVEPDVNFAFTATEGAVQGNLARASDVAFHGGPQTESIVHAMRFFGVRWISNAASLTTALGNAGDWQVYACENDRAGAVGSAIILLQVPAAGAYDAFGPGISPGWFEPIPGDGEVDRPGCLQGAGLFQPTGTLAFLSFRGYLVGEELAISDGPIHLMGGSLFGAGGVAAVYTNVLSPAPNLVLGGFADGRLELVADAGAEWSQAGIVLHSGARLTEYGVGDLDVYINCAGSDGIRAYNGAYVAIVYTQYHVTLDAGQYVLRARRGGLISVEAGRITVVGGGPPTLFAAGETPTAGGVLPQIAAAPADGSAVLDFLP